MFLTKRFFPLFTVQFLGALNDNVFKNALVILLSFKLAKAPAEIGMLITLAAGIFILPFFLFSATAGRIADSYDKTWLIRKIKLAEILIMLLGALAFLTQSLPFLFAVLFLMGLQSAFFGPIKYAILPEHLPSNQLLKGNGWFSASTFIAILLGTVIGGLLVMLKGGETYLSVLILSLAVLGFGFSLFIPPSVQPVSKVGLSWNVFVTTWQEIKFVRQYRQAFFAVLAISWFWFLGASYLSQIPVLVKDILFADNQVVHLFLIIFSVGIALGALIVNRLKVTVRSLADIKWLALLLLGISVAMWLANMALGLVVMTEQPLRLADFFFNLPAVMTLVMLAAVSIFGGMYIVPLYTLLQVQTPLGSRARVVAVNNIINAVFMVVSAILILFFYMINWNLIGILTVISVLNLIAFLVFNVYIKRVKNEVSI